MTGASDEYDWHNSLPHPRWEALYKTLESLPPPEQGTQMTNVISHWLQELTAAIGPSAGVLKHGEMFCLYSSSPDQAERLLRWSSSALARIIAIVGDHRTTEMVGPRIIMVFDDIDRYYDYIDKYYPDAGEYGGSSGICVSRDYYHVIVGPGDFGTQQSTLAHELTHLALGPLAIPLWLDEGIAQVMQEVLLGGGHFHIDREIIRRHQLLWKREGLQTFWTGESFNSPGEMEELSYHLAEVLTRNIHAAHGRSFITFLKHADWHDAGDAAAREVLGRGLDVVAAEFLGEGDWKPHPLTDD